MPLCITHMQQDQMSDKSVVEDMSVTCECDIQHDWEISRVCERNSDGGAGANQG